MIPALIIVFREGFEAFLSVAIILAYLRKTGRESLRPAVYAGIVTSIVASFALGWWLMRVSERQSLIEGIIGLVLLLFTLQIRFYSIHEFSEAEVLGRWSEAIHNATEPYSPVGIYGKWISVLMVGLCAAWLVGASMKDRFARSRAA